MGYPPQNQNQQPNYPPPPPPPQGQPPYPNYPPPQGQNPYPNYPPPQGQNPYPGYPPPQGQYPYPGYPPQYAQPPKKPRGACGTCLLVLLVGAVVLVALGVGGYLLFKNGVISERQLLALTGRVPGEVSIYNLTGEQLEVTLNPLDRNGDQGSTFTLNDNLQMKPMDVNGFTMDPGRYTLRFSTSGLNGSCTLKIAGGDIVRFAAASSGIIVTSKAQPSKTDTDLRLETSPLCNQ